MVDAEEKESDEGKDRGVVHVAHRAGVTVLSSKTKKTANARGSLSVARYMPPPPLAEFVLLSL